MSAHDDGGPAFPVPGDDGMTLRDWFAGQALAEAYREMIQSDYHESTHIRGAARRAYAIADAMIAARKGKA